MRLTLLLLPLVFLFFISCKKEGCTNPAANNYDSRAKTDDGSCIFPEKTGSIFLEFRYKIDNDDLQFDNLSYANAAGNLYSITNLLFYTSRYVLHSSHGDSVIIPNVHYHDVTNSLNNSTMVNLGPVPAGTYNRISFIFGLPPEKNIFGELPATQENNNMFWPEPMGGGYHYMKMEGRFMDENNQLNSHATHLGRLSMGNKFHDPRFKVEFLLEDINIMKNIEHAYILDTEMNLNEWFYNPHLYDFNDHLQGTMEDTSALRILGENGKNAFRLNDVFMMIE